MTLGWCSISLLFLSLASATRNLTDVNDAITVVDQLDTDRLKGVWFNAIVSQFALEACTLYEFGSLYRKHDKVLLNATKMFRYGLHSNWIEYRDYTFELSPTEQSKIIMTRQDSFPDEDAVMHRIGAKQYHRVDNEFLIVHGTHPVSVLVRYPDVFREKYADAVLRWLEPRGVLNMVHPANYSACHYSPFSVYKLPDNLWNSDSSTDSQPDRATPITDNYVELGIDWLTTNSYRDAIVETSGNYFDENPETPRTDSYDTDVESTTTNGYPITDVEATGAETYLETASTPDHNSNPIEDGATTIS